MGGRGASSGASSRALIPEEIEALQFYSDGNGRDMNDYLRGGDGYKLFGPSFADEIEENADMVSNALKSQRLPEATEAFRGSDISEFTKLMNNGDPQSLVGKTYSNKGLLSTTTDRKYAESLANDYPSGALVHVNFSKGSKALDIEPYVNNGEKEILGASNIKFKITKAYNKNGILHVFMNGGK